MPDENEKEKEYCPYQRALKAYQPEGGLIRRGREGDGSVGSRLGFIKGGTCSSWTVR